ncbi:MAG: hybrid sensor histidine kinase/response regulator, partial [Chloroflexota bacterium]
MPPEKTTILYIEDDPASRMLVDRTLRYAGYSVLIAERGIEGIDIARSTPLDLILTDINLPDITGRELTTMLRADKRFEDIPIVALTAADYADQRDLAMAAGITGYITKPVDIERLPKQLEFYLKGGRDKINKARLDEAQTTYAREVVTHLESRIRELEEKNKDLTRLDQIKDVFIQITAHELRTPLTLIYGYSRLLQDNPQIQAALSNENTEDSLIGGLVTAVERMQGIVNEILTISRIMTDQMELSVSVVNLVNTIRKVQGKYTDVIGQRSLNITLDESGFPSSIRADSDMVEIIIDNLMSNAIKYTPDGGKIDIGARRDESNVFITFKDTGIGIPPEDIELIFDIFHTANDPQLHSTSKTAFAGGGLGLGLAICKGIVEAHGGN